MTLTAHVTHLLVPPSHSGCSVLSWSLPGLPPPPHLASDGHTHIKTCKCNVTAPFDNIQSAQYISLQCPLSPAAILFFQEKLNFVEHLQSVKGNLKGHHVRKYPVKHKLLTL